MRSCIKPHKASQSTVKTNSLRRCSTKASQFVPQLSQPPQRDAILQEHITLHYITSHVII
jgi:hypothetical protein